MMRHYLVNIARRILCNPFAALLNSVWVGVVHGSVAVAGGSLLRIVSWRRRGRRTALFRFSRRRLQRLHFRNHNDRKRPLRFRFCRHRLQRLQKRKSARRGSSSHDASLETHPHKVQKRPRCADTESQACARDGPRRKSAGRRRMTRFVSSM